MNALSDIGKFSTPCWAKIAKAQVNEVLTALYRITSSHSKTIPGRFMSAHPTYEELIAVYEKSPFIMLLLNKEARIREVNRAARNFLGLSRKDIENAELGEALHCVSYRDGAPGCHISAYCPHCAVLSTVSQTLQTGQDVEQVKTRIRRVRQGKQTEVAFFVHTALVQVQKEPCLLLSLEDITERERAEEALRRSENYYRSVFETSGAATIIIDEDTTVSLANPRFEELTGYSRGEIEGKMSWTDFVHHQDVGWMTHYHYLRRQAPGVAPRQYEFHLVERQGRVRNIFLSVDVIEDTNQSVASLIDITERKQAEEALRRSEDYYRTVFETSGAAMFIVEEDTTISLANTKFIQLGGYTREEVEGIKAWTDFIHPEDKEWMAEYHFQRRQNPDSVPKQYEFRFLDRGGNVRIGFLSIDLIPGTNKSVASFFDITRRKQMEERLKELSLYDSLTGLYNRNYFEEEMARLQKTPNNSVGIIVCDLDGLKFINDTLGHESGDVMLLDTARILRSIFCSGEVIARIGGDEFAVLFAGAKQERTEQLLQSLRDAVSEYNRGNPDIPLSLSAGHVVSEEEPRDMQALFREANDRMYRDKIQRVGSARSGIVEALTRALEARDFNTEGHSNRLQELVACMGQSLGLSRDEINDLILLARFHDLGKVGIPDHVLFKPGSLTERERQQMRGHCDIGKRIAQTVPDLDPIADFIYKHHERWDGLGYPQGLQGKDIPLQCRILAIADAYDAMTSDRPYREAMDKEEALKELHRCSGTQFDPYLVKRFIQLIQDKGLN